MYRPAVSRSLTLSYAPTNKLSRLSEQSGFSLFELCIVLIVIGILIIAGYRFYLRTIEGSKYSLIMHQAAVFSRTVENMYGNAKMIGTKQLSIMGTMIYINEKGWPASAIHRSSVKSYNQTPQECEYLWQGIFSNAPVTVLAGSQDAQNEHVMKDFIVDSINGRICRYELARKQEGRYFFDYDVSTGEVTVSVPEEDVSSQAGKR